MNEIVFLLNTYGYLVLFLGVVVEGEIFPLAAGVLASLSLMNLYGAIGVTFLGAVLGDWLWFRAARRWGRQLLANRWGRMMFRRGRLARLEQHFAQNGKRTLFLTKFIYSFGHSSIVVAGIAGMDEREFIKVDLVSSFLWACLFVLLGQFFGSSFDLLQHLMQDVVWAAIIVGLLLIIVQYLVRKRLSRVV